MCDARFRPSNLDGGYGGNDAAVSGADPIETRAGFAALLDRIEGNGVRTVIVEDASRFARELMAQESGHHPPDQPRGAVADGLGR